MKNLLTILISLIFTISAVANVSIDPPAKSAVIEKDFPLFFDMDEKLIFIDFSLLISEVSYLFVVDVNDNVILEEDCKHVRSGAIYEINYSNFDSGRHSLELLLNNGEIVIAELDLH